MDSGPDGIGADPPERRAERDRPRKSSFRGLAWLWHWVTKCNGGPGTTRRRDTVTPFQKHTSLRLNTLRLSGAPHFTERTPCAAKGVSETKHFQLFGVSEYPEKRCRYDWIGYTPAVWSHKTVSIKGLLCITTQAVAMTYSDSHTGVKVSLGYSVWW